MAETTIPCDKDTRERLADLRGNGYKNWDEFLNALADRWENSEDVEANKEESGDGDQPDVKDVLDRLDDMEASLPRRVAEELHR